MAKAQTNDNPQVWTQDDLLNLSSQVDNLGDRFKPTEEAVKSALERLVVLEGQVAILDPTKASLPVELTKHVNLGQIYSSAIASGFQAMMITNPQQLVDTKFRQQNIDKMLDLVDMLIVTICRRHGVDNKAKVN